MPRIPLRSIHLHQVPHWSLAFYKTQTNANLSWYAQSLRLEKNTWVSIYLYIYICMRPYIFFTYVYIYIHLCNPNAVALIRAHVSMYILLRFIHVGYIYICHDTFLRIPMPHTPTSFRPPSLWPQVKLVKYCAGATSQWNPDGSG